MKLSRNDTGAAAIRSTHAVDIFAFVEAKEIPFSYFETPYYLSPAPGGEKMYALLRETLDLTKKIGIAHVVIQTRRHLAALIPCGPVLILNTLRLPDGGRSLESRERASEKPQVELTGTELAMAATLMESLTQECDLDSYREAFLHHKPAAAMDGQTRRKGKTDAGPAPDWPDAAQAHGRRFADAFERLPEGEIGGNSETASAYTAQRNSRPRSRWRRILH